jgi:hypothetical protein
MTVAIQTIFKFPSFDTGRYEGCEFLMSGGDALLTVNVDELPVIKIAFQRVRWHEFTALYNCSSQQVQSAYFAVAEVLDSPSLAKYMANDKAPAKAYRELHHFRVFLDETGCHEVYAQACSF